MSQMVLAPYDKGQDAKLLGQMLVQKSEKSSESQSLGNDRPGMVVSPTYGIIVLPNEPLCKGAAGGVTAVSGWGWLSPAVGRSGFGSCPADLLATRYSHISSSVFSSSRSDSSSGFCVAFIGLTPSRVCKPSPIG